MPQIFITKLILKIICCFDTANDKNFLTTNILVYSIVVYGYTNFEPTTWSNPSSFITPLSIPYPPTAPQCVGADLFALQHTNSEASEQI